jgi:hypothetical protein
MTDNTDLPQDQAGPDIPQPGLKFLETAVYIMGGLLVLMLLGLIGGIIWKVAHRREVPPPQTQLLDLGLASGSAVQAMQLDGDRLALDTGPEIIVIDIAKNAVISRISIRAK